MPQRRQRRREPSSTNATTPQQVEKTPLSREVRGILEPFASAVARFIAAELRPALAGGATAPRYYTAKTSPLPPKAFLAAARERLFPSFVVKRRVFALCDDVHRFMDSSRRPTRAATTARTDDDEIGRLLDESNLRPRRRR